MSEEMRPTAPDRAAWAGRPQYSRSFMAKLALSSKEIKEYYALLVTELLSYEKMNARVGWAGVTFMAGRRTVARVTIVGKTLCLFLAADPASVSGARYKALTATARKYEKTPALFKIRSQGAARNAARKVAEAAALWGLSKKTTELPAVTAKNFPSDNFGNLVVRGLIRILNTGKGTAFAEEAEEILPEEADEKKPDKETADTAADKAKEKTAVAVAASDEKEGENKETAAPEEGDAAGDRAKEKTADDATAEKPEKDDPANDEQDEKQPENIKEDQEKPAGDDAAADKGQTAQSDVPHNEKEEKTSEPPLPEAEKDEEQEKPSHPKHTDRAYADTVETTGDLLSRHDDYAAIMSALSGGDASVRVTDRYVVRAIDELWVKTIEDSLFAIDEIIRHPTGYIAETEEVLPIELTKKVTGRSIVHLAQHSDYISKDEDDNLTPTKLLNVFREDSLLTYENKFINTLLSRLAFFIDRRYEVWTRRGADERIRRTEFSNRFELGESRGKVTVTVEMSEQAENDGGVRNTTYDTDLFRRVSRLHGIAESYMKSPFVRNMGKNYVHPPILRTNVILKNKYFRQCLALWEFIESYEDAGYGLLVEEKAVHVSRKYLRELYEGAAMQYLLFCHEVCEGFGTGHNLSVVFASAGSKLQAKIDGEYYYPEDEENTFERPENGEKASGSARGETFIPQNEAEIIAAVEAALLADEMTGIGVAADAEDSFTSDTESAAASDANDTEADTADTADAGEAAANVALTGATDVAGTGEADLTDESISAAGGRVYRSFAARLCEMEDEGKENLAAIANHILRYPKVSMRISRDFMTFRHKKRTIARIAIRGKSLYVYLPLAPEEAEERFRLRPVEDVGRLEGVSSLLLVRSPRSLRYAMELTERICTAYRIGEPLPEGKHPTFNISDYPRRSLREMIEMGLIHISGKLNGVPEEGFSAAGRASTEAATAEKAVSEAEDDTGKAIPAGEDTTAAAGAGEPSAEQNENTHAENAAATDEHNSAVKATATDAAAAGNTVSEAENDTVKAIPADEDTAAAAADEPPHRHAPKKATGEPVIPVTGTLTYAEAHRAGAVTMPEGALAPVVSLPEKAPDPSPDHDTSTVGERVGMEPPLSWQANEDYSQPEMFGLDDSSSFMEDIREQEMKNAPEKKHEKPDKN